MGYYTSVTGEIAIQPPLTWKELKDSPFNSLDASATYDVRLRVNVKTVDTDEGQLIHKTASAVLPREEGPFTTYRLVEHVQAVIDAFPGHTFTGRLECEGSEAGDLWRIVVRDGRAVRVEPRIVWPDDKEHEG